MERKRALATGLLIAAVVGFGVELALAHGPGRGMLRHQYFTMHGLPASYARLANPLPATPATIATGRALYDDTCAVCHGPGGRGDGEGGKDLDPPPGDLMAMVQMPMASDGYLFWAVSEGGEAIGTAMPAFKDLLSADDRWAIITALRAGLPPAK